MEREVINFNNDNRIEKIYEFFQRLKKIGCVSYYIFFGYKLYNKEINNKKYGIFVCTNEGFIKLNNDIIKDLNFIIEMFEEYQLCSLIVNKNANINYDLLYTFTELRILELNKRLELFKGCCEVLEITDEYMVIEWNN